MVDWVDEKKEINAAIDSFNRLKLPSEKIEQHKIHQLVTVNLTMPKGLSYKVDRTVIDDFNVDLNIIIVSNEALELDADGQDDSE